MVRAIGEALLTKFGWSGLLPLFEAYGLTTKTKTPTADQILIAGFLSTCQSNHNPTTIIKNLLEEREQEKFKVSS